MEVARRGFIGALASGYAGFAITVLSGCRRGTPKAVINAGNKIDLEGNLSVNRLRESTLFGGRLKDYPQLLMGEFIRRNLSTYTDNLDLGALKSANLSGFSLEVEKIRTFLAEYPKIASFLVWDDRRVAEDPRLLNELFFAVEAIIQGKPTVFPILQIQERTDAREEKHIDYSLGAADAQKIYFRNIAHSLLLETKIIDGKRLLPWSITEYPEETLGLLYDSYYEFSHANGPVIHFRNSIPSIIEYDRHEVFRIMNEKGIVKATSKATHYALIDVLREQIVHSSSGKITLNFFARAYGDQTLPSVGTILKDDTHIHPVQGCHALSTIFVDTLQAVNIPVFNGWHRSSHAFTAYPTEDLALPHNDAAVFMARAGSFRRLQSDPRLAGKMSLLNPVQSSELFITLKEFAALERQYGGQNTMDMIDYYEGGVLKRIMSSQIVYPTIYLRRAEEIDSLEAALSAKIGVEAAKQQIAEIDGLLKELGNGDMSSGINVFVKLVKTKQRDNRLEKINDVNREYYFMRANEIFFTNGGVELEMSKMVDAVFAKRQITEIDLFFARLGNGNILNGAKLFKQAMESIRVFEESKQLH